MTEFPDMDRFVHLLLDTWREVCRHIEIGESVDRVVPILTERMPLDVFWVRRIDVNRSCVETVATGQCRGQVPPVRARSDVSPDELAQLLAWCEQRKILHQPVQSIYRSFPGLCPEGLDGEVLAGPLRAHDRPAGAILLFARPPVSFTAEHAEMLQALLEPFEIALDNDLRVRELTSLREALEAENQSLLSRLGRHDISDSIVGAETGLRAVMEQIELVARSNAPVLVLGETGSGKEVVARAIHSRSRRASKPFLRINCGAIPPELVDSELFGHERGSFTGAVSIRKGWFERADGGTLFLDECGELPLAAQVRLLRILQDGTFERVGGEKQLAVDVRIVAATHRDLHAMVAANRFREDLWYRIAVFPIRLPPLRDRKEDIASLAGHFALRAAKRLGTPALVPTPEDIGLLVGYSWPGNVRELAAVIERAAILGDGKRLDVVGALGVAAQQAQPLPVTPASVPARIESKSDIETLDAAMAKHIEAALLRTHGRIEGPYGAALLLDINPHTLRARMRKLGLNWGRYRRKGIQDSEGVREVG
jgi:transcriptional regulator with GAF, ATPase, and Fis domain